MKRFLAGLLIGLVLATAGIALAENPIRLIINGQEIHPDVPPQLINGRVMVPARFVAEPLGAKVEWDGNTKTIKIISQNNITSTYKVTRVVDGDTIKIDYNGKEETVRMIGVNTPESVHPDESKNTEFGKIASDYTKSQLEGEEVRLELDAQERDQYGRLLAYVYIGDRFYNAELLKKGYAQVMTIPPNVKYADEFIKLQKEAQANKVGIWADQQITQEPTKIEGKFIGSKESDKYHYPNCRWAQKITPENEIWFDTIEEAEAAGYEPCGVCKPK